MHAAAIVGLTALLVASAAGCSGGDKQPAANAGSAADSRATSTTQAAQPRKYAAMAVDGELHAMLAFQVHPEGGQLIGKYTMVHFDGQGKEVREKTDFNGRGSDSTFEFDGLTDYGVVTGALSEDRTRLTLDRDFGVQTTQWTIVSSTDVFESAVKEYAKRFESCSKKQDVDPCEGVA
ncbi:hypothetical protein TPA0598_01_01350 [Streptomyces lydicamycinicus]|uniref:Lipoprotein n=2 Tax=Streptomyces lydicamycinicus TaxID=1546107 RepID=A0A0P4QZG9_9ACTN|nr:hypothetical protein TPA0598_01_01350 [Streptomyces lydicamycinicus]